MDGDDQITQDQVEDKQEILDIQSEQEKAIISKELQKAEKIKMSKTKKIVLTCTSLFLLIAIVAGGLYYRNTTAAAKNEASYKQTMEMTQMLIVSGAVASVNVCETYSSVWRAAIDSRYKDFNTELANQKSKLKSDGTLTKISETKDTIDSFMKKLNNPSEKYKRSYDKILEMYGIYSKIESEALSPSGSLMTFNSNINNLQAEFLKSGNELKVIMPSD
ncbi:MAG: hypothetical protein NHB14_05930 [Desulfosporosinus sp.]|nr:hypothetical protein [Desulfosporosinus sp.]